MYSNINVGLLGHVDSGKTSLSKALSKISSTAAFDKNPQSQERGITLDLGFSALNVECSESLKSKFQCDNMTFTFVDCPGHQSLIKTIIGGSQIIDLIILVVDIQKGFETQTGECLILGEVTQKKMIVVVNKIDMIEESKRNTAIDKMSRKIQKTLETTIFKDSKIIPISATTGVNIDVLISTMIKEIELMEMSRLVKAPFIFVFDHCFSIKGSGTVLSGTILQGSVKVNDTIEIPQLKIERKIKSMQMFRKPVNSGSAGDRLGICITNFDSKLLERGLLCQKSCVQPAFVVIMKLHRIRYFKREIKTKMKFHCSIGHDTVMGNLLIFSSEDCSEFDWNSSYNYEDMMEDDVQHPRHYFALLEFENPVMIHNNMLLIGSKLDTEQTNVCRLAFHGKVFIENSSGDKNYQQTFLTNLKIFKTKSREGTVQRVVNNHEIIAERLFKKETDRSKFIGMKCQLSSGELGTISGAFGESSKVRIQFINPLQSTTIDTLKTFKSNVKVNLCFKKFIFDKNHRMIQ